MTSQFRTGFGAANASPWRRAAMCIVDGGVPAPARLERIDGRGAAIRTNAVLRPGETVTLSHPRAGEIDASVLETGPQLALLGFEPDCRSVGFAMAAIAGDLLAKAA